MLKVSLLYLFPFSRLSRWPKSPHKWKNIPYGASSGWFSKKITILTNSDFALKSQPSDISKKITILTNSDFTLKSQPSDRPGQRFWERCGSEGWDLKRYQVWLKWRMVPKMALCDECGALRQTRRNYISRISEHNPTKFGPNRPAFAKVMTIWSVWRLLARATWQVAPPYGHVLMTRWRDYHHVKHGPRRCHRWWSVAS